ncbi:hypothetical protein IRJ41_004064 [Triplophysa rosa]|uniref:Uncharacterized protein n=1 Tax=Triplophysa rosa TaxID=992332 RepID=A0A9W7W8U2_TRIRA|nr:hypothetical protein IRJ41_004064 [Triplophysa rosa]
MAYNGAIDYDQEGNINVEELHLQSSIEQQEIIDLTTQGDESVALKDLTTSEDGTESSTTAPDSSLFIETSCDRTMPGEVPDSNTPVPEPSLFR